MYMLHAYVLVLLYEYTDFCFYILNFILRNEILKSITFMW